MSMNTGSKLILVGFLALVAIMFVVVLGPIAIILAPFVLIVAGVVMLVTGDGADGAPDRVNCADCGAPSAADAEECSYCGTAL